MIRKRKSSATDSVREKAEERLRTISSIEVMNWSEQAINGFHRNLDEYRLKGDPLALADCRQAVSMLAGALDVLEAREERKHS